MSIFKDEKFKSAAGIELSFKIDCDGFSDEDLACISKHVSNRVIYNITEVISVPTGGDRLAKAFASYVKPGGYPNILVVDDVWTTGRSMLNEIGKRGLFEQVGHGLRGLVLFARGSTPQWVHPVFTLHHNLQIGGNLWTLNK